MKVHVIVLDQRNAFPYFRAKYLHDKRLVEIYGRKWFSKGIIDRFHVNPDHILNERGKLGSRKKRPLIIVDNATRTSVHPDTLKTVNPHGIEEGKKCLEFASSVKLTKDNQPLDTQERNKLNYLIEESFWSALLKKTKTPLSKILILLVAGIGLWQLIRAILIVMNLASGPI